MKLAIAHDTLTEYGGAERVLQSLLRLYPDAHVFTAYCDYAFIRRMFPSLTPDRLHVSAIQRLKLSRWGYLLQFLAPAFWKAFNFENYDIVISSSSFFLSNTIRVVKPIHIQYILGPPKNIFGLSPKVPTQKYLPYENFLAREYKLALNSGAYVVTDSKHMQQMLRQMFDVVSHVIYPPVIIPKKPVPHRGGSYYLTVSRLDDTKEIETVIHACSDLGVPLKVVGVGSDSQYVHYLCSLAGPTVDFLGFLDDTKIRRLYKNTIAFLFSPRAEDFGIAAVEAMAHGVPVIAYYGGGAKETVIEGITGTFFYEYTPESLKKVIRKFNPDKYDYSLLYGESLKFSEARFYREISRLVESFFICPS